MDIILASPSRYTKSLLNKLGIGFRFEEVSYKSPKLKGDIKKLVNKMASDLAKDVYNSKKSSESYVISTFSMIAFDGKIFGRPANEKEAYKMLKAFNGKKHVLVSALVIYSKDGLIYNDIHETTVKFKKVDDEKLKKYANTEEALGNIGAYFVQGKGSEFIEEIKGSYFNLVGIDLNSLITALEKIGVKIEDSVKNTIKLQEKSIKESFPR